MKFGVLQFFSWTRRIPLEQVYARAFDRIAIMDEGGYDAVWLAEHHFNTYSVCPSVTQMGTYIAARTKNLRIGTAVTLAGFYHPLRLAEELALLDTLSGGRLNWGAGRGFDSKEFRAFNVPVEESSDRFRECVEIVRAAWANDRLSFHGQFWDFDDVEILPKPLQQPSPPVWLAATSPESVQRAAE
ncbi:MAG: LLM class flavin-dependent oxidoreductase [Thermoflexaceae bacterium]|nr:LLM class flavin-dependent oxidoreductase [Thermoflexaceae bacterium]